MRILALKRLIAGSTAVIALVFLLDWIKEEPRSHLHLTLGVYLPQLEMQGGDPYIRALMRTISASEANNPQPYTIILSSTVVST